MSAPFEQETGRCDDLQAVRADKQTPIHGSKPLY
jgi:hypothetical protein